MFLEKLDRGAFKIGAVRVGVSQSVARVFHQVVLGGDTVFPQLLNELFGVHERDRLVGLAVVGENRRVVRGHIPDRREHGQPLVADLGGWRAGLEPEDFAVSGMAVLHFLQQVEVGSR